MSLLSPLLADSCSLVVLVVVVVVTKTQQRRKKTNAHLGLGFLSEREP